MGPRSRATAWGSFAYMNEHSKADKQYRRIEMGKRYVRKGEGMNKGKVSELVECRCRLVYWDKQPTLPLLVHVYICHNMRVPIWR